MLQLNRAKFSANGNCGYVLKPNCMCQGKKNEQNKWITYCVRRMGVDPYSSLFKNAFLMLEANETKGICN